MRKWPCLVIWSFGLCLAVLILYISHTFLVRACFVLSLADNASITSLSPSHMALETPEDIWRYYNWANYGACDLYHDFGGTMQKAGFAGLDGQKSVCLDPGVAPVPDHCLVYSFGISDEWSFDEAMEQYGCQVYAFDPSMHTGGHQHSRNIHFYQLGLGIKNEITAKNWKLRTLQTIISDLNHTGRTIDCLKIDIKQAKWDVIPQLLASDVLKSIKQIQLEIFVTTCSRLSCFRHFALILRRLEEYGFVRFSLKGKPWNVVSAPALGRKFYSAYEIAWYNQCFKLN